jgi:hypothetical protein
MCAFRQGILPMLQNVLQELTFFSPT